MAMFYAKYAFCPSFGLNLNLFFRLLDATLHLVVLLFKAPFGCAKIIKLLVFDNLKSSEDYCLANL